MLRFHPIALTLLLCIACWGGIHAEEDNKTWAFAPPIKPVVPEVAEDDWAANPIDTFILSTLQEQSLAPSPEAERGTLIRRLYLDVLGLPPTPAQVEAFVKDSNPEAWVALVDEVLASPHYGERWARHWLDVVRFAETNGYETNTPRPNAWPYRDYVIEAFNKDIPYTQFIKEQLAGDVYGEDRATGFLVGGPWDEVKSPDIVLTRNQRDAVLHDMVSTTSATFLGLTVGCAKCHDHKFDPVSMQDYYQLRAIFAGVKHGEREIQPKDLEARQAQAAELIEELTGIEQELAGFLPLAQPAASLFTEAQQPARLRLPVNTRLNEERFAPIRTKKVRFRIAESQQGAVCIDELEIFSAGAKPENVALASSGATARASSEYPNNEKHRTAHINDGRHGNSYSWIPSQEAGAWIEIEFPEIYEIDRMRWGRDRNEQFKDRLAVRYAIAAETESGTWQVVASSFDRAPVGSDYNDEDLYQVARLNEDEQKRLKRLQFKQDTLTQKRNKLLEMPKIYGGQFVEPEPTYFLHRGDPMKQGDPVGPGGITRITPALAVDNTTMESQRRIALAEWLTHPENPLTARVMVNRIWQHHFGKALVQTPSDFGAMGFRPSHPELLDWLAVTFMEDGWHPKALHRRILLSKTYRQGSAPNSAAQALDADNRLLWRYSPRRLEAEPIRDSMLAVSGVLDTTMGGPGYNVFEPNENYVRVYTPKTEFGPEEWRRMIYQYKPRMEQDETFGIFDCPDGGTQQPRRTSSTTPLQALNMLNSPFVNQQAERFAARLQDEAGGDAAAQVAQAFQLALGRSPDSEEVTQSIAFIQQEGLTLFCRALYNTNEFLYIN